MIKLFINPELSNINRSLVLGDNLYIMEHLIKNGYSGKFDMIYFDGPFNSGLLFSMFNEKGIEFIHPWDEANSIHHYFQPQAYLDDYKKRITLAKELLSDKGIFVLQTNQIMGHYVKVAVDEVFEKNNCLMEVIWKHSQIPWTHHINQFGYQHETLFFYSKTNDYYKFTDKTYPSVWDDIGGYELGEENTLFPSQKPEALLKRIIEATTKEGDLIGDFYSGSGTLPYIAEKTNRRWFASDNHPYSIQTIKKRFSKTKTNVNIHSVVESFNPEYLDGYTYSKKTHIPFSLLELKTLQEVVGEKTININAYSFSPDVDLLNQKQFHFNLIMPSLNGENDPDQSQKIFPRPFLIETKDGYKLKIENSVEWIFHHIVHAQRNKFNMIHIDTETKSYLKDRKMLLNEANEISQYIQEDWIQTIEDNSQFVTVTDIFGYRYMLRKN